MQMSLHTYSYTPSNHTCQGWLFHSDGTDKEGKEPVEKRGLYDLYIDNHIDIPDTISKESPCYKQFMKELEGK